MECLSGGEKCVLVNNFKLLSSLKIAVQLSGMGAVLGLYDEDYS